MEGNDDLVFAVFSFLYCFTESLQRRGAKYNSKTDFLSLGNGLLGQLVDLNSGPRPGLSPEILCFIERSGSVNDKIE